MDKQYQDLHVRIEDEEVFTLRMIELLEMAKRPKSFMFRYRSGITLKENELIIAIIPRMAIIID